jgi:hypothetical protein
LKQSGGRGRSERRRWQLTAAQGRRACRGLLPGGGVVHARRRKVEEASDGLGGGVGAVGRPWLGASGGFTAATPTACGGGQ